MLSFDICNHPLEVGSQEKHVTSPILKMANLRVRERKWWDEIHKLCLLTLNACFLSPLIWSQLDQGGVIGNTSDHVKLTNSFFLPGGNEPTEWSRCITPSHVEIWPLYHGSSGPRWFNESRRKVSFLGRWVQ